MLVSFFKIVKRCKIELMANGAGHNPKKCQLSNMLPNY